MRIIPCMKLFLLTLAIWVVVYFSWKTLLSNYLQSIKFDLDKYEKIDFFLYNESRSPQSGYDVLPKTDYNRLINISFGFSIINFTCEKASPLLLILVHSSSTNFIKRKIIRDTWGKNDEDVKVLFMLGYAFAREDQEKLQKENNLYKDIIQGTFWDSYKNLTYKHTMALKYVVYHCPETKYVLKTDDDIFVNVPFLKNFLTNDLSPFGAKKLLMCPVIQKARVYRTFRVKWRVSFDEYEHRHYPTYCLGWSILYSPDLIFDLYKEAQRDTYFWIDDVYITGMVADKINFTNHVNILPLTLSKRELRSLTNVTPTFRPFLFGSSDMSEYNIRSLWNYVLTNPVPASFKEALQQ